MAGVLEGGELVILCGESEMQSYWGGRLFITPSWVHAFFERTGTIDVTYVRSRHRHYLFTQVNLLGKEKYGKDQNPKKQNDRKPQIRNPKNHK